VANWKRIWQHLNRPQEQYEAELQAAWHDFVEALGETSGIYRLLDWLTRLINRISGGRA
jgi:hypothetical protein